jgi:hypothetical protein
MLTIGDLDGDGKDLAVVNTIIRASCCLYSNTSSAEQLLCRKVEISVRMGLFSISFADIDGDGNLIC